MKWVAGVPTAETTEPTSPLSLKPLTESDSGDSTDFAAACAQYLRSINLEKGVIRRIEGLVNALEWLCPEPLERILIGDRLSASGKDRELTSLWGFSTSFCMETKDFLRSSNFDMVPYLASIVWIEVEGTDVAANREDKAAELKVTFHLGPDLPCELTATGPNCNYLKATLQELLVPNMRRSTF